MCNPRALLITAAVGAAVYTGGASLGLLGGAGAAGAAGGAAAAVGTTGAVYGATAAASGITGMQAIGLAAAATGAFSAYSAAKTQQAVAAQNASLAENKAQEDERVGELNAQKVNEQTSQLMGTQRATMAARGLDLGTGTPADIIAQTSFFGQNDAATARYNGQMAAWGDRQQGAGFAAQAAGYGDAAGLSLLQGAGSVASKWYRFGGPGGPSSTYGYGGPIGG